MIHTTLMFCLPFCGPNVINHFFCDISLLLSLACTDTSVIKCTLFTLVGAIGVLSGLIIMISYVCILVAILRIQTADGRTKECINVLLDYVTFLPYIYIYIYNILYSLLFSKGED